MKRIGIAALLLVACGLAGCPTKEQQHIEPARSGERSTVIGGVLDRADQSECEQYVHQLNQAVQVYRIDHETNPPDLAAVVAASGLSPSVLGNCTINYDPNTGAVTLVK